MLETRYVFSSKLFPSDLLTYYLRHYSYECKATAQERPYMARPSRTQQLQNPKLRPQLTTDVPEDATKRT